MTYCLRCGEELTKDIPCKCGSNSIIFGDNIVKDDKGFRCGCMSDSKLSMSFHLNHDEYTLYNYKCNKCGNILGVQHKKKA